MQTITRTLTLPYVPEQLYALVADIERYPQFLPYCEAARIHWQKAHQLEASLHLSYKGLRYSFTTQNENTPHSAIHMQFSQGPFKKLSGRWGFEPEAGAVNVTLELAIEFKHKLMQMALGHKLDEVTDLLVTAFEQRAHALYGGGTS